MIFSILHYSVGCIFGGIATSAILLLLIMLLCKGWYSNIRFTLASYLTFAVMGVILLVSSTVIWAAVAAKSKVTDIEATVTAFIPNTSSAQNQVLTHEYAQKIGEELDSRIGFNPIELYFGNSLEYNGIPLSQVPAKIGDDMRSSLNGIILRWVLWTLPFLILGVWVLFRTVEKVNTRHSNARTGRSMHTRRPARVASRARTRARVARR